MSRDGSARSARGSIAIAVGLAASLAAGPVRAQVFAPQPAYPVQIEGGEPDSSIVVRIGGGEYPCGQRCTLSLAPGAYNLRITDAGGNTSSENMYVQMPTRATVTTANRTARIVG